ncbi:SDR family oxidoreductase [Sphingosinicellaceae bacterium]|nr:SDR family oxidoreductase [Sphingosinicellaceae bacterium]
MTWTLKDAPSLSGCLAVVTGASGGLGLDTALGLASKGATVVVAARDPIKGRAVLPKLGKRAHFELLDLADLSSIEAFGRRMVEAGQPVDILVNNAGLAAPPKRSMTRDGFEVQFGTNFLGHFALTGRLLPLLRKADGARVVSISSLAHKGVKVDFDDLMSERRYSPVKAYGLSKLADLIFARELQRRSDANGWQLTSVAAHPGLAMTELTKSRPGMPGHRLNGLVDFVSPYIGQSSAAGALITLHAATSPDVLPGGYYGPDGFGELKGQPRLARSSEESNDPVVADRLWRVAESLTTVVYEKHGGIG